jgi:hypothetical protein
VRVGKAGHGPTPCRIAGESQRATVARLTGHEKRMPLRVVGFGQNLGIALELAALEEIGAVQWRELLPCGRCVAAL